MGTWRWCLFWRHVPFGKVAARSRFDRKACRNHRERCLRDSNSASTVQGSLNPCSQLLSVSELVCDEGVCLTFVCAWPAVLSGNDFTTEKPQQVYSKTSKWLHRTIPLLHQTSRFLCYIKVSRAFTLFLVNKIRRR
jgi:hypothetical protein